LSSRLNYLSELEESSKFIFKLPNYDSKMLIFKKSNQEKTIKGLKLIHNELLKTSTKVERGKTNKWTLKNLDNNLKNIVNNNKLSPGDVFWPVRVAVSGLEKSPSPAEILLVLGKQESLTRINKAINKLRKINKSSEVLTKEDCDIVDFG